jgi:hypothetical protein
MSLHIFPFLIIGGTHVNIVFYNRAFNSLFILPRIALIINCRNSYFKVASLHGLNLDLLQSFYEDHST